MSVSKIEITPSHVLQRYYPWVVIAIAFLTVGVAFGTRNAFAVFLVAVIEEFRWSRGLASGALMLGSVMWTLAAPVIGILLDRLGPRVVLPGGAIIMALGFVISGMAHSVAEFYIGMGVFMGVGFAALPMTSQATFLIQLVYSQTRHGDRNGGVRNRFGDTFSRALDAVADRHVRLARGIFHPRGCVGDRDRAFELFLSTPETGGDESQA